MNIFGVHAVEEALALAPGARVLWVDEAKEGDKRFKRCMARARGRALEIKYGDRRTLDKLAAGGKHQGVVLDAGEYAYTPIEDFLEGVEGAKQVCVVILDGVQDVGNFGAVARSAAALGADAILMARDRSCEVTPGAMRASAGQLWRIPVIQVTNLSRALDDLKAAGFWVGSTGVVQGEQASLWQAPLSGRLGMVLGSEHDGVRKLVAKKCDFGVWIPMSPGVESLNVSAAAAVVLAEIARRRHVASAQEQKDAPT